MKLPRSRSAPRQRLGLRTLDPISRGLKLEEDGEFILCKYDEFFVKELHADTHTLKVEVRNRDGVKKFDDLMLTTFELILSDCFEKLKDHNYETLRI